MASNYFAPGHSQRNPYGTYQGYKGYQADQQAQRNQMTVGGSNNGGGNNGWQSSVNQANDWTGQLMGMLGVPDMPTYYSGIPNQQNPGGMGGGGGYGGGGSGGSGMATTTGQINPQTPFTPDLTQMGINQARADAFTDPYLMREAMGQSGVAANSPSTNMAMAPQIAQMMSNMALQAPTYQFQDAATNAMEMLRQRQAASRENLGMAQNMGQLSDIQQNYQQGQLQNLMSMLFGLA